MHLNVVDKEMYIIHMLGLFNFVGYTTHLCILNTILFHAKSTTSGIIIYNRIKIKYMKCQTGDINLFSTQSLCQEIHSFLVNCYEAAVFLILSPVPRVQYLMVTNSSWDFCFHCATGSYSYLYYLCCLGSCCGISISIWMMTLSSYVHLSLTVTSSENVI